MPKAQNPVYVAVMQDPKDDEGRYNGRSYDSGSGKRQRKTMVTCGLLTLLKRKGYNPAAFKCGPDYIDGLFHRRVLGVENGNLDSFLRPEHI